MSRNKELLKRPNQLEAESLVQTTSIWIERRYADEHVRAVAMNPLLGPSQQTRSKPLPTTVRPDA